MENKILVTARKLSEVANYNKIIASIKAYTKECIAIYELIEELDSAMALLETIGYDKEIIQNSKRLADSLETKNVQTLIPPRSAHSHHSICNFSSQE